VQLRETAPTLLAVDREVAELRGHIALGVDGEVSSPAEIEVIARGKARVLPLTDIVCEELEVVIRRSSAGYVENVVKIVLMLLDISDTGHRGALEAFRIELSTDVNIGRQVHGESRVDEARLAEG